MIEHKSVMLEEVLDFLQVKPGRRFIDATVGGGGHIEAMLKMGGVVLGIDQDPTSLDITRKRLEGHFEEIKTGKEHFSQKGGVQGVFKLVQGNFANLQKIASSEGFDQVDGIIFDLGFASFQLEDPSRGLSFLKDGPLDMRLDPTLAVTAADLVNSLPEAELCRLFKEFGDERRARSIAHAIVARRAAKRFGSTGELKELIESIYQMGGRKSIERIHPATRVFMALRIVVNSEFENLKKALSQSLSLLKSGGCLVVISFHSGEDRIVKNFFKEIEFQGKVKVLTMKPLTPKEEEVAQNPRARSAKLRAIEKI